MIFLDNLKTKEIEYAKRENFKTYEKQFGYIK